MNAGLLLIEASVDRGLFGWTIPATSFNALDGLFCIMAVPLLIALWQWQAKRNREPHDLTKITIGYLIIAAANLMMVVPAGWVDHDLQRQHHEYVTAAGQLHERIEGQRMCRGESRHWLGHVLG